MVKPYSQCGFFRDNGVLWIQGSYWGLRYQTPTSSTVAYMPLPHNNFHATTHDTPAHTQRCLNFVINMAVALAVCGTPLRSSTTSSSASCAAAQILHAMRNPETTFRCQSTHPRHGDRSTEIMRGLCTRQAQMRTKTAKVSALLEEEHRLRVSGVGVSRIV